MTLSTQPVHTAATLAAAGLALLLCLAAAPAEAQLARTFVSNAGSDLNDCNRATPCRTFQRAHDNTLPLGEITVLDAGGYGAVTINRAISIINDGVGEAGVLVSGGANGITINAGATDAVSLRGLTIKGIGFGGGNGIVFNSGGSLTVENGAIRTLTETFPLGVGILFQPNAASHLAVLDTIVTDNGNDAIFIRPLGSGTVTASLSRVELINNRIRGLGLLSGVDTSTATINAVIADSVIARNNDGIDVFAGDVAASVIATRSMVSHNSVGIQSQLSHATARIGASTLTGNAQSWRTAGGGVVQSYGDNRINGNGDGDPAPPLTPRK
jgi:hypothetical protein